MTAPADAAGEPLADPRVLVVLVNWGLAARIDGLLATGALGGGRVVIVDNASEPDEVRAVSARHGAEALLLDRNWGFAGGVNRAVASAGPHAHVLLLNADVEMGASTVNRLRAALVSRDLTGVAPLVVSPDGRVQLCAGGPLTARAFAQYYLGVSHVWPRARGIFLTRSQTRKAQKALPAVAPDWLTMGCLLLRGDAFDRHGQVPEDELAYGEDLAWGTAATRAGARFALVPDVLVTHEQGAAGAGAAWHGALARLAHRELGPTGAGAATAAMSLGLAARTLARRGARLVR